MAIKRAFLDAKVMHARHAPKKHVLRYNVWYLCLNLSDLPLIKGLNFLSHNRRNILSLFDRDYGISKDQSMVRWIEHIKKDFSVDADGETTLVTMPRVFLHGFNPVSFWFMQDQAGQLRAVLAEVNNTFGERHCYLCRHEDNRPIQPDDWLHHDKVFHVSPFMPVKGNYDFRFRITEIEVGIWINYNDDIGQGQQRMLTTSLLGTRQDLNDKKLMFALFRYPLVTLKVVAMIHWHALQLLIKGIQFHSKPQPPTHKVSR